MVILCGVCVWHAVIGAAATVHYDVTRDHDVSPEVTSSPETTSPSSNVSAASTVCPSSTPEMVDLIMADKLALAMFSTLYILFHAVFIARIYTSVSPVLFSHAQPTGRRPTYRVGQIK